MPSVCVFNPFMCRKGTHLCTKCSFSSIQIQICIYIYIYCFTIVYEINYFNIYLLIIHYINLIIVQLILYYYLISYRNYLIKVIVVFINLFSLLYSMLFPIIVK